MVDREAGPPSLPDDWPAKPELSLALNGMGCFDWDLGSGLLHLDQVALGILDLRDDEYDGTRAKLMERLPPGEGARLDALVGEAMTDSGQGYGAYFRVRRRDGTLRWTHSQGHVRRDDTGRPLRVIGIIRDATQELADSMARLDLDEERRLPYHRRRERDGGARARQNGPGRHRRAEGVRRPRTARRRRAWSWASSTRGVSIWSPRGPRAPSCRGPGSHGWTRSTR